MLMLLDNQGMPPNTEFFNHLVYNIPGCYVESGFTAMSYLAPFAAETTGSQPPSFNKDFELTFLYLVFEQPGLFDGMDEAFVGCNGNRVVSISSN